jgi:hypothetical protein
MPKELPPYTSSTGLLQQLFQKIKEATPPVRFTQDYLFTNLGFKKSGSTTLFIPFLKRIGFLSNDGSPTDVYKKFRNPDTKASGAAMAQSLKVGYSNLFNRNEYWFKKNREDLRNFLIEVLELEQNSAPLKYLITTIETLKKYADFDAEHVQEQAGAKDKQEKLVQEKGSKMKTSDLEGLNLSYTINLNLPETSDIKVFDAIFKSLKENLLNK